MIRVLFFHSQLWVAKFFARLSSSEEVEVWAASKVQDAKTLISTRNIKYVIILPGTKEMKLDCLETFWWYYKTIRVPEEILVAAADSATGLTELLKKVCK